MVKNPLANAGNAGDTGSIPRSGRSPGEGGNSMDGGAQQATISGVAKESDTT